LAFKRNAVILGRITDGTARNTSFASNSHCGITTGTYNNAHGYNSSDGITTGGNNTSSIGTQSLRVNSTGSWNTGVGRGA
jgi:hypothetical protein